MEDEHKVVICLEKLAETAGGGAAGGAAPARAARPRLRPNRRAPRCSREPTNFFAVFDGHAGGRCSKALVHELAANVARDPSFRDDICAAIRRRLS